jgi:hypothetical protein
MRILFLLAFGGLCFGISLILAWVLAVTLFFPDGILARYIVSRSDLIRAHIDYLMMAQFIFIFALLFRQYSVTPPLWVVAATSYGAFFNPLGFLKRAITPKPAKAASVPIQPHFPPQAAATFIMATIGFLASVVLVICAAHQVK